MRTSPRLQAAAIAVITSGIVLGAALPAAANGSGGYVWSDPWTWYVGAGAGEWGVQQGSYSSLEAGGISNFENSQFVFLDPEGAADVPFACTGVAITEGSDFVITCDDTVTVPWGFSATSSARILAPGDLLRLDFVVTNTAETAQRLDYSYTVDFIALATHVRSSQPTVEQDLSVDGELEAGDVWSYFLGNTGWMPSGVAWGAAGAAASSVPELSDDAVSVVADGSGAVVEPGETVVISFFHKLAVPDALEPGFTAAAAPATDVMAEFASFDGRLTRGLPDGADVVNWQPAADVIDEEKADPELADTGVDAHAALFAAATLLGLGALLLLGRRRVRRG